MTTQNAVNTGSTGLATSTGDATIEESHQVLQKHARSFSLAAFFLPSVMRDDAAVAYAFCRKVDDAVDEAPTKALAEQGLEEIVSTLGSAQAQGVEAQYSALCQRTGVGLGPARDLIDGARSDLDEVRVRNMEDFLLYCYRVAGTVGAMMCGVLRVDEARAVENAVDLGIGMQITNICRDVVEDAQRGRVYLPAALLHEHGVTQMDLIRVVDSPDREDAPKVRRAVSRVVSELLEEAEVYYRSGVAGLRFIPVRPRLAIGVALRLYREIGRKLQRRGCDPFPGRVRVSRFKQAQLVARSVFSWASDAVLGALPAVRGHKALT